MIKPVKGYTLIEAKLKEGKGIILGNGVRSGDKTENIVVAVSKADKEIEWKVGDSVALGEGAKGFTMEDGKKNYILMNNAFVIAIL